MAKKSAIAKNNRRLKTVLKYKDRRAALVQKLRSQDPTVTPMDRMAAMIEIQSLPRDSSITRYRNRCMATGRPRGYTRFFGLSRICVRERLRTATLPGVSKSD